MPSRLLLSLAALVALPAVAQPSADSAAPDPTNAAAPTAPLDHRSSFEGYQRYAPEKPAAWRAANRAVGAPAGRAVDTAPAAPPPAGHKH